MEFTLLSFFTVKIGLHQVCVNQVITAFTCQLFSVLFHFTVTDTQTFGIYCLELFQPVLTDLF